MNIKAIALDMDGTALDSNNTISRELVTTLKEVQKRDIKIILATGRTMSEIGDVLPRDFPYDAAVTSNGMGCYVNRQEIIQYSLEPELVQQVITEANNNDIYYELHTKQGNRFALSENKPTMEKEVYGDHPESLGKNEKNSRIDAFEHKIKWEKDLITNGIVKIYFFSKKLNKINNWKQFLMKMKEEKQFTTSSSSEHNVEIMVEGVSKGTGLNIVLEKYKLSPDHLMVIGDGENDLAMFDLSGYAVAMKNANAIVKEKADEVTQFSNEENGLDRFLNNKLFEMIEA